MPASPETDRAVCQKVSEPETSKERPSKTKQKERCQAESSSRPLEHARAKTARPWTKEDDAPPCKPRWAPRDDRAQHFWRRPVATQLCQGIRGATCTLALDASGTPGAASESDDRCVFCSSERFEKLTRKRGGCLVTHYLSLLRPKDRQEALRIISTHGGEAMSADYSARLKRLLRRHDPSRPKRKPRGKYATNKCRKQKKSSEQNPWGVEAVRATQQEIDFLTLMHETYTCNRKSL